MSRLPETVLNLIRGDTGKWTVTLTDNVTGAALNLTGCSLRMSFWADLPSVTAPDDSGAALVLTTTNSDIVITSASTGIAEITMTRTESAALTRELYRWDIQLTNADDEEYTAARGVLWIEGEVTHTANPESETTLGDLAEYALGDL